MTLFCKQDGPQFGDEVADWLDSVRLRVKRSTFSTYGRTAARYILPELGGAACGELTNARLAAFLDETGRACATGTLRLVCHVLRATLRFAHARGRFLEADEALAPPMADRPEARTLTAAQQRRLEAHLAARGRAPELGVLLCMYTGLRLGEVCALRWGDFAPDCGVVHVRRTLQRLPAGGGGTELVFGAPKSGSSRRAVPVPTRLAAPLRALRGADELFFLTGEARPLEPRRFQARFKTMLRAAGVPDINFHALRHTFATNCVSLGCDAATLSRILGHSSVSITLNTYVHPSFDAMREVVERGCCAEPS